MVIMILNVSTSLIKYCSHSLKFTKLTIGRIPAGFANYNGIRVRDWDRLMVRVKVLRFIDARHLVELEAEALPLELHMSGVDRKYHF